MKKLTFALLFCFTPFLVGAQPLKVVEVHNPDIHCVFSSGCTVDVDAIDTTSDILGGFLRTRTYKGRSRSRAAGLYGYEYRLDLRDAIYTKASTCIRSIKIDFGDVIGSLNYGGDAKNDQAFVITAGGGPGGSIGLAAAVQTRREITFTFSDPVCPGAVTGGGRSTFIWGLVSTRPPRVISASLETTGGALTPPFIRANVRAPR